MTEPQSRIERKLFQQRVRERVAAGLHEDDEGDDFQPWVWAILFEEVERLQAQSSRLVRLRELAKRWRQFAGELKAADDAGPCSQAHLMGFIRCADELEALLIREDERVTTEGDENKKR